MSASNNEDPPWYLNRQRTVRFDESDFRKFLATLAKQVAGGREFAVLVSSDAALRRANTEFRGERAATDVLSFPDEEEGRLGDILISAQRAERQAGEYGHSVEEELKVLALHGVLHLLGYDHEADDGEMRRAETGWRRKFGLPQALVERVDR